MSRSVTRRFQAVCDRRIHTRRAAGREPTRKILERQRVQQAAADTAKKPEDATKEAEETARVAAAQAAHEQAQVSLSGQKNKFLTTKWSAGSGRARSWSGRLRLSFRAVWDSAKMGGLRGILAFFQNCCIFLKIRKHTTSSCVERDCDKDTATAASTLTLALSGTTCDLAPSRLPVPSNRMPKPQIVLRHFAVGMPRQARAIGGGVRTFLRRLPSGRRPLFWSPAGPADTEGTF
jgi:hypothetical protein